MNKVYINKETDMVEQILNIKTYDELPDDYFDNCYAVIDEEGIINAYNIRFNKEIEEFEVVEGMKEKDEVVVIKQPTVDDFQELKSENEDLKSRLEKLEQAFNIK